MKRVVPIVLIVLTATVAFAAFAGENNIQEFTITVDGMSYSPAEISVEKGVPVRLKFFRMAKPTCGDKVLFPELKIERDLPAGKTTVVEFTPSKAGDLTFTCGMKMMKGKVVVKSN